MIEIVKDVTKGKLHSAYAIGPFDKAKDALESEGYRVISLEEQAGLRIQEGADSSVSTRANWAREGVIYIPIRGIFLTKNSPIMDNAKGATECNRHEREFYLHKEKVEKALASSVRIDNTEIPTDRFSEEALTNFAFGKNARDYGEFLKENGIDRINVWLANAAINSFARQAWLSRNLNGCRSLGYDYSEVRGVREAESVDSDSEKH